MATRVDRRRSCAFGPLLIAFDDHVLRPRPWTAMQSEWAAELSPALPSGPILELCAGAGQIGLLAAVLSGRSLVQVERDRTAVGFARDNAAAADMTDRVEIRCAPLEDALGESERFPLIVADPPYLRRSEMGEFPEDPPVAIDGGDDGLELIRACVDVARDHLAPEGACLLQVAGPDQVDAVRALIDDGWPALTLAESRVVDRRRAVALIRAVVPTYNASP
jgi:methylase of polypeptide subunit release factors